MSDDPKLSQRYRELPREEPSRALDDAILAASRRAVQSRPAPLVAPSGRRRWYVPLAAAAVITLSVAVTLQVQHDRPSEEVDAVSPSMKVQEAPAPAEAPKAAAEAFNQAPSREARRDAARPGFAPDPKPAADADLASAEKRSGADARGAPSPQASASAPARAPAPAAQGTRMQTQDEMRRNRAEIARVATPEVELERIGRLRAEGRHEEADKALAEFRKRYPDYRFSDEMKAKVERRQ